MADAELRAVADHLAILNLKARYCHRIDDRDHEGAAAVFTEDGVWDGGGAFGRAEGRQAIADFFRDVQRETVSFAIHSVSNPLIEVEGDEAIGRWYLWMPCTFRVDGGEQAMWGSGRYTDRFERRSGEWQIREMRLDSNFWTPFDRGWAEQPFPAVP